MDRPLINKTTDEIIAIFKENRDNSAKVKQILEELSLRTSHKSRTVMADIKAYNDSAFGNVRKRAVGVKPEPPVIIDLPPSQPNTPNTSSHASHAAPKSKSPEPAPSPHKPKPKIEGVTDNTPQTNAAKAKIAELRQQLLDLSNSNRLLNFKHSARGAKYVRIIDECPLGTFAILQDGRSIELVPVPSAPEEPEDEQTEAFQEALEQALKTDRAYLKAEKEIVDHGDDDAEAQLKKAERTLRDRLRKQLSLPPRSQTTLPIKEYAKQQGINTDFELKGHRLKSRKRPDVYWQTLFSESDLERRMRDIAADAREAKQEYGIDTLNMIFGFLEWTPKTPDGEAEDVVFSPLIIQPIEITKRAANTAKQNKRRTITLGSDAALNAGNGKEGYTLSSAQSDAPCINHTLKERLKEDFEIVLPDLDPDTPKLEIYFALVEAAIKTKPNWRLRRFITLAHLSFSRLPMWKDLNPTTEGLLPPHLHPILAEIFGGRTILESQPELETKSIEVPNLILDCDHSQYAAIKDVLAGKNLVIQGPPGTGKSQTIANLIAAALGANKTVLFVAEKQVALEVVNKRLADAKLGDFILELHSAKAGKKEVMESISHRLNKSAAHHSNFDEQDARSSHLDSQKRLDEYAAGINSSFGETGMSVHDIIWEDVSFHRHSIPESLVVYYFNDVKAWTKSDWENRQNATLEWESIRAQRASELIAEQPEHPWSWIQNSDLHVAEMQEIKHFTKQVLNELTEIHGLLERHSIQPGNDTTLLKMLRLGEEIDHIGFRPENIRKGMWDFAQQADAQDTIDLLIKAIATQQRAKNSLEASAPGCFRDPIISLQEIAFVSEKLSSVNALPRSTSIKELQGRIDRLREQLRSTPDTIRQIVRLTKAIGFEQSLDHAEGILALVNLINLGASCPDALIGKHTQLGDEGAQRTLGLGIQQAVKLQSHKRELSKQSAANLDSLDEKALEEACVEIEKSWFGSCLFSAKYRSARRLARKVSADKPIKDIRLLLAEILTLKKDCSALRMHPAAALTDQIFCGADSDISILQQIDAWSAEVRKGTPIIEPCNRTIRTALFAPSEDLVALCKQLLEHGWTSQLQNLAISCHEQNVNTGGLDAALRKHEKLLTELMNVLQNLDLRGDVSTQICQELEHQLREFLSTSELLHAHAKTCQLIQPDPSAACRELQIVQETTTQLRSSSIPELWQQRMIAEEGCQDWASLRSFGLELKKRANDGLASISQLTKVAAPTTDYRSGMAKTPIDLLRAKLVCANQNEGSLDTQRRYLANQKLLETLNLASFIERLDTIPSCYQNAGVLFRHIGIRSLSRQAFEECEFLRRYRQKSPGDLQTKFRELDHELKNHDRNSLVRQLMNKVVPEGNGVGLVSDKTEKRLLEYVCGQQRPRITVRDLLKRAGNALQTLKPCFMMSPLSVAQLVDRNALAFDLVIFDEASQVRPEDALSAFVRGRQIVVVGDKMQLPPTNYMMKTSKTASIDDEGSEEDSVVMESILELAAAAYGEGRTLLWHYRSRDPNLIAFSNKHFYKGELQIFPSTRKRSTGTGVHLLDVQGVYSARTNLEEAKQCAMAAIEFMAAHPDRSLGIVALNKPQAELIELEVERIINATPHARKYKERWESGLEPLFIKNLESVQGDERDCIFISTVFGKDSEQNFYQRFGPINSGAGHRRLNVLFTRAKYQVVVFTSMQPDWIHIAENSHRGVRALKEYLEFARSGLISNGCSTGKSTDSPFEDAVRSALAAEGFDCEPQVGVSGFFIDLAVRNPRLPNHYILGIECDGATYHSSRSARDRDRLRQEILENLGWKIYRVWSTDWYTKPAREVKKLVDAIKLHMNQAQNQTQCRHKAWEDRLGGLHGGNS